MGLVLPPNLSCNNVNNIRCVWCEEESLKKLLKDQWSVWFRLNKVGKLDMGGLNPFFQAVLLHGFHGSSDFQPSCCGEHYFCVLISQGWVHNECQRGQWGDKKEKRSFSCIVYVGGQKRLFFVCDFWRPACTGLKHLDIFMLLSFTRLNIL